MLVDIFTIYDYFLLNRDNIRSSSRVKIYPQLLDAPSGRQFQHGPPKANSDALTPHYGPSLHRNDMRPLSNIVIISYLFTVSHDKDPLVAPHGACIDYTSLK